MPKLPSTLEKTSPDNLTAHTKRAMEDFVTGGGLERIADRIPDARNRFMPEDNRPPTKYRDREEVVHLGKGVIKEIK